MFTALEEKSIAAIETVKFFINAHEELAIREPQRRKAIGVYSVTSCVIRLYAVYEKFVETILSDYLDTLSECVKYSVLPDGFKTQYRIGISVILSKLDYTDIVILVIIILLNGIIKP